MDTIKITLPTTKNINQPLNEIEIQELKINAIKEFSLIAGGCTIINGLGGWLDSQNNVIVENVYIVSSFIENAQNAKEFLISYAQKIKKEYQQESVLIELNQEILFV